MTRRDTEDAITALASRQHGVVTRTQLITIGVSPDIVDRRLKARQLRPLQRGVYFAGPLLVPRAREMAATLACGTSAVVSHRSAAALWQLLPDANSAGPVDVIIPQQLRRGRPGIRIHRIGTLRPAEVTKLDEIPLTTPARTLYDLAATASSREVERALAEAFARRLANRSQIEAVLTRYEQRPGSNRLRALLMSETQPARTRSEAEESFLALIRQTEIPRPEVNIVVSGYEVDFFWRAERFVVEIDGFAFHLSQRRFDSDRRRDAVLAASGVRVIRVTWPQIKTEPEALLVRLAQALARASAVPV